MEIGKLNDGSLVTQVDSKKFKSNMQSMLLKVGYKPSEKQCAGWLVDFAIAFENKILP